MCETKFVEATKSSNATCRRDCGARKLTTKFGGLAEAGALHIFQKTLWESCANSGVEPTSDDGKVSAVVRGLTAKTKTTARNCGVNIACAPLCKERVEMHERHDFESSSEVKRGPDEQHARSRCADG